MESSLDPAFLPSKKPPSQSPEQKRICGKLVQENKQKENMCFGLLLEGYFISLFVWVFFLTIFKIYLHFSSLAYLFNTVSVAAKLTKFGQFFFFF